MMTKQSIEMSEAKAPPAIAPNALAALFRNRETMIFLIPALGRFSFQYVLIVARFIASRPKQRHLAQLLQNVIFGDRRRY